MHHLRVFYGREYGVFLIYHRDRLVHRSCLFPRYQRFPFMATNDLQIGDVWTDPAHQNRGLASFAIEQILYAKAKPGRALWYVVDAGNFTSIRMVEKLGFLRVGVGRRSRRLGLSLLGQFLLEHSEATEERRVKGHICPVHWCGHAWAVAPAPVGDWYCGLAGGARPRLLSRSASRPR